MPRRSPRNIQSRYASNEENEIPDRLVEHAPKPKSKALGYSVKLEPGNGKIEAIINIPHLPPSVVVNVTVRGIDGRKVTQKSFQGYKRPLTIDSQARAPSADDSADNMSGVSNTQPAYPQPHHLGYRPGANPYGPGPRFYGPGAGPSPPGYYGASAQYPGSPGLQQPLPSPGYYVGPQLPYSAQQSGGYGLPGAYVQNPGAIGAQPPLYHAQGSGMWPPQHRFMGQPQWRPLGPAPAPVHFVPKPSSSSSDEASDSELSSPLSEASTLAPPHRSPLIPPRSAQSSRSHKPIMISDDDDESASS